MNTINFKLRDGFPMNQSALDKLQSAFSIFNSLGNILGDKSIISGCELTGTTVSDGVVYYNGEVLNFKGGVQQTKVIFKEDVSNLVYKDENSYPVVKTRYMQFGTGVGSMNWLDFQTNNITALIARIVALEARPLVGNIPIGLIAIWELPANEIPVGWQEHVPLRGRTPLGMNPDYDSNNSGDLINYNLQTLGYAGGFREIELTENQLPKIDKTFDTNTNIDYGSGTAPQRAGSKETGNGQKVTVQVQFGNNEAHSNMSPYRIVHFIKYIGV